MHTLAIDSFDGTSTSVIWKKPIPINYGTQVARKRFLVFRQLVYIIANWNGDQYPNVIYICHDNA